MQNAKLGSDSYSGFLNKEDLRFCNKEVKEAHKELLESTLGFANKLSKESIPISETQANRNTKVSKFLINRIHEQGINVRYLGLIRSQSKNVHWRNFITIEVIYF